MALNKIVTIGSSQSIFDIALQYYGSVDKVFDVVRDLGVDSINSDITGITFTVTNTTNQIYQYTSIKGISIGSKNSPLVVEPLVLIVKHRVTATGDNRITAASDDRITN